MLVSLSDSHLRVDVGLPVHVLGELCVQALIGWICGMCK